MKNFFIAALALLFICSCQSQSRQNVVVKKVDTVARFQFPPLSEKEKQHYTTAIENLLNQGLFRTSFNGAVLVAKNGTIVYENYRGFRDLKAKDSITPETPFQIASTTKPLTAAAVLKLAEQGKLSLNDSVSKFFPGFPYPVTIMMLLSHRSGLPNYLYYMEKSPWPRTQQATNQDILKTLMEWQPPQAVLPGRHFNYCNTNYVVLASIVEKVTGQTFPDYMKATFFDPLEMKNTFVHQANQPLATQSYQPNGAPWTLDFSDGPYGDKNIYSTPRDLLKWDIALYEGKILSKQMLDSAATPYSNEKPGVRNYGLGWRLLMLPNNKKVVYHTGRWHGFNTIYARLEDEYGTIIILGNRFNRGIYTTAKKMYNLFGSYDGRDDESDE
ncbi:MAG TPA: serine hydrolase [Flavisolibacter sp.]